MSQRTADEATAEYVEKMGQQLGELFSRLWQEVALLHMNWSEFVEMYGTDKERVDTLNRIAPSFFRMTQDCLWEATLLHIARLTDSPRSLGRRNLSLRSIPPLLIDVSLKARVEKAVDEAATHSEFCRDWRNRHIAHRDFDLAMKSSAKPLLDASHKLVDTALGKLASVLNEVQIFYLGSETAFSFGRAHHGAISLLHFLETGPKKK